MTRSLVYTATEGDEGMRLDALLAVRDCYPSRSSAVNRIDAECVFVNGTIVAKRYLVAVGDVIVYEEAPEEERLAICGEDIPLDIRYEDDDLIVLSKQRGLICHPSHNHSSGTLVNALIHRYGHEGLAHVQGDDRPGIVHRLDGDTTGLMLCAKTDEVGFALQEAIRLREVDRRYITLVHGNIAHETGEVDAPIARNEKDRLSMTVSNRPSAREALTAFKVIERFEAGIRDDGYTLLECKLFTGRTHQIRVHMKYIHHCVVGDRTYGAFKDNVQLGLERQFLHSYRLGFTHPVTGERLEFIDALAPDLQVALGSLSSRGMGCTAAGEAILADIGEAPSEIHR